MFELVSPKCCLPQVGQVNVAWQVQLGSPCITFIICIRVAKQDLKCHLEQNGLE